MDKEMIENYGQPLIDDKTGMPIIWGNFGDEKKFEKTISPLPVGQLMILPDGQRFRRVKMWDGAISDSQ